ncbi:phospho-N-acetylmuramoyl-pentapeptide-transferase [Rippkaea orientalis PCC 8801]|uniref:Phospho-N-acetylmuramoyl-pentapeptide-transferase n=1 Tax=Rippkaea orientalis (strain PCC 8801 / RF-1) TaxID=41431 RepID=MRAY_RIPO1|nr:phospho-N-acetylmuramoyl-pentapeptide-transferase [Rippkaea orientalis]B7JVF4.1 RecName: Full=Phospho-N-acetylmuramoyl-pentapeptide-transferase; AltName: Full=UDP-MurNAc-pentapeptide phosphotransferase [Rippkaea orientalis PCC 8801]ACK68287.1 phospho-N-acetylmuramoyl-pentapeptide-transferase [Rippkaea orientalis PCC 8801]
MDAKIPPLTPFKKPSGTSLLILLILLLGLLCLGFAQILDLSSISLSLLFPLAVSAICSAILGYVVVPVLRRLKAGQVIQEDGPQTHLKKAGTPTMGGIFFVPVAVIIALIWSKLDPAVLAVSIVTLAYMGIGWIDDWQILRQKSNKGLTPRMKLILQIAIAVGFCIWTFLTQSADLTNIALPGQIILPLGLFFWIIAGFVLVAESNATNLTDGVDGLAGGTGSLAFLGLAALMASNNPGLMIFCACMSGGCLGFIVHNRNPATVFMGDTGSLALGGSLGAIGILSGHVWGLFLVSGIFFVESLSVIAQVSYYKATKGPDGKGKRLLKMAPLHHHLELSGWAETQIVGLFYLINAGLAVLAVISS